MTSAPYKLLNYIMPKYIEPTINQTAFNCPHCGALTSQTWHKLSVEKLGNNETPRLIGHSDIEAFEKRVRGKTETDEIKDARLWHYKMIAEDPFIFSPHRSYPDATLYNSMVSECYNCSKIAVWVKSKLVYPAIKPHIEPNEDMPPEISATFKEAVLIVNESPKSAAALLRLCIQHLCIYLGKPGKKIDDDIASLVKDGLHPTIQKSMDIVRVVGNESVHPGTINVSDDKDLALKLFDLVNLVTEQMISIPKGVDALYSKLPESKRKAIEARDQ